MARPRIHAPNMPSHMRTVYLRNPDSFLHLLDPRQLTGHVTYVEPNSEQHIRSVFHGLMKHPAEGVESLSQTSHNRLKQISDDHNRWLAAQSHMGGNKKRKCRKRKCRKRKSRRKNKSKRKSSRKRRL